MRKHAFCFVVNLLLFWRFVVFITPSSSSSSVSTELLTVFTSNRSCSLCTYNTIKTTNKLQSPHIYNKTTQLDSLYIQTEIFNSAESFILSVHTDINASQLVVLQPGSLRSFVPCRSQFWTISSYVLIIGQNVSLLVTNSWTPGPGFTASVRLHRFSLYRKQNPDQDQSLVPALVEGRIWARLKTCHPANISFYYKRWLAYQAAVSKAQNQWGGAPTSQSGIFSSVRQTVRCVCRTHMLKSTLKPSCR